MRRLFIVEPGGYFRGDGVPRLRHGIGHWVEAIERFASWWSGPAHLIGNEAPEALAGIDAFHRVPTILRDADRPMRLRVLSRAVRAIDPLLACPIGARLLRADWERAESRELIGLLERELAAPPETTIFVPTAIAITAESLIRNASRLTSAAGGSTLRLRIRFSSQGHERRAMDPRYFALQMRRWSERAAGIDLRFGVEVESMAHRYAQISGLPVAWVPWPGEVTACRPSPTRAAGAPPKFFLYSLRSEQGSLMAPEIAASISMAFSGNVEITTQVTSRTERDHPEVLRKLVAMPTVQIAPGHLPPTDLHGLFADAAAIVLPYDRKRYRGRGSALMWAALDHGIPMIAPAGTGFGDDIARHGIGYSYRSENEISALCRRAAEHADELKAAIAAYQVHRAAAIGAYFA